MAVALTHELIEAGRSGNGGWTKAQLAVLGVPYPPRKGWKGGLVRDGKILSDAEYAEFLRLKGKTKKVLREERRGQLTMF